MLFAGRRGAAGTSSLASPVAVKPGMLLPPSLWVCRAVVGRFSSSQAGWSAGAVSRVLAASALASDGGHRAGEQRLVTLGCSPLATDLGTVPGKASGMEPANRSGEGRVESRLRFTTILAID